MTTQKTIDPRQSVVVPFEDNRLAVELFGEYDSNLAMLEERLGIEAVAHGNVVTLSGPDASCEIAREVLEGLYERLAGGESVAPGDIDGAIRHASAAPASDGNGKARALMKMEQIKTRKRVITARSPMQSAYLAAMNEKDLVFATGPAGTGKTYLSVAHAAAMLERGEVERLILSRPAIEAGERLGFLPGDMREKVDPYLRPLYDALYDVLALEKVDRGLETGVIEIAPLAFMRGRTLSNAAIILDEAQNCTSIQMKMFLTRIGEGSKMMVTGDPTQIDLPTGQHSGLAEAIGILNNIPEIAHIAFNKTDVVRRELVSKIVSAYDEVS